MKSMSIVLLEFYPKWLALPRSKRNEYAKQLEEIIARHPLVSVRFFDAESLPGANYTDFVVCETSDLQAYHFMWEEIRDSNLYYEGFFKIKDVVLGFEEAFKDYEQQLR